MEIGSRIKIKRKENRFTQIELAKLVNVSPQVISNWERGYSDLSSSDVARLADALNCSTEYLLGKVDNSNIQNNVNVAGQEITLSIEELQLFNELKKHPIMFHDLASDPETKVKELIELYRVKKILEKDEIERGDGFGELED